MRERNCSSFGYVLHAAVVAFDASYFNHVEDKACHLLSCIILMFLSMSQIFSPMFW